VIQVTPQMRVLVAIAPADFRKGIDGLAKIARVELKLDPFSGTVFVFRNRRGTAVKLLVYDGQGFWLCQKRLSKGRFTHWPSAAAAEASTSPGSLAARARKLRAHELHVLLSAGDFEKVRGAPDWRRVGVEA
jgi:transposase